MSLETVRVIYAEVRPLILEGQKSDWEKMEEELKDKFPEFNIEEYQEPVKDWFKIRTVVSSNLIPTERLDIHNLIEAFDLEYPGILDDEKLNKVFAYITEKFAKKVKPVERK